MPTRMKGWADGGESHFCYQKICMGVCDIHIPPSFPLDGLIHPTSCNLGASQLQCLSQVLTLKKRKPSPVVSEVNSTTPLVPPSLLHGLVVQKPATKYNATVSCSRHERVALWRNVVQDTSALPPLLSDATADAAQFTDNPWIEPPHPGGLRRKPEAW